jgi:hypothetical protein
MKTLAKIHVAKRDLGLDDDEYRAVLERTTGERSARNVLPEHIPALQRELRRLGWQGYLLRRGELPPRLYDELGDRPGYPNPAQLRKLDALFNTTPGYGTVNPRAALRGFLQKRFGVADMRFLDLELYEKALNAVRTIRRRMGLEE